MRYTWLDDVLLNTFGRSPGGTLTIASTNTSEEMNSKTYVINAVFSIMAGLKLLKEIFLLL